MSASEFRRKRCSNAIAAALAFVRRDGSAIPRDLETLERRFCSPSGALEYGGLADDVLTPSERDLLALIPSLTRAAQRSRFGPHPKLHALGPAAAFLHALYLGVSLEQFYLLCLDDGGRLLEARLLQSGTVDRTPFYLGNLLKAVVNADCSAIVLSHNHPAGTPKASRADVACTLDALSALQPLGIPLLDHVIIADQTAVSIRASGAISEPLWLAQAPDSALNVGWLNR